MALAKSALTTSKLLASIRRRTMAPEANITFKDDDLIEFLNEELLIGLVPSILQTKDEYLVFRDLIPLESGKTKYTIPERSLGNKLRELKFSDDGINEYTMTRLELENGSTNFHTSSTGYYVSQFHIQGNEIILPSTSTTSTGNLVMYYYMRPNFLVPDDSVAVISAIDRVNGIITVSKLPTTYNTDQLIDFVRSRSPHNIIAIDIPIISLNQVTKTLVIDPADIPSDLQKGDYVPLAGETCIPNIPTELHAVLSQRVGLKVLESLGDSAGIANAEKKLAEMEMKTGVLIDSRVEGAPAKVVNSSMRNTLRRNWRGF